MHNGLTTEILKQGLNSMARKIENCFHELNALDSQIGDGDLGVTVVTGFREMLAVSAGLPGDVGMALSMCSQAFTGTGGSSFGTLFATGILAAAKEVKGQTEVAWSKIPELLTLSIEKMAQRGKSRLGDKTVLDGLAAIRDALPGINNPDEIIETAYLAVNRAVEDFKNRPCKQGRARIFLNKSIGIDDPGMIVIQKLVESFKEGKNTEKKSVTSHP